MLAYCYNDLIYIWNLTRDAFKTYEKYGKGFPVFENEDGSEDDLDAADAILKRMRSVTGVVTPKGMKFRFDGINGKHIDPTIFYDMFVTNIACAVDLPVDEFRGIYEGERQAADVALTSKWQMLKGRQKLIDNVIRRILIDSGILPDQNTWMISWIDPFKKSEEQKDDTNSEMLMEQPSIIEEQPVENEEVLEDDVRNE
jgi:hypothetical protein